MTQELLHSQETEAGWIEVWQEGHRRSLRFDDEILQSEIDLKQPGRLPNPANRSMLAHLLFGQQPENVLLAGCGGGAIARWFHYHSPDTRGTAVELSADVAGLARDYFEFPGEESNWTIEIKDVRDQIRTIEDMDFILVDIATGGQTADWVTSGSFLADCRRALSPKGVLTLNLIGENTQSFAQSLWDIRQAFNKRTLCLTVPEHENIQVMAFKQPPELQQLDTRLAERGLRWGLAFETFWSQIKQDNPQHSGIL